MINREKLKEHWGEHKTVYICVGVGISCAGITYLMMRRGEKSVLQGGADLVLQGGASSIVNIDNHPFSLFSKVSSDVVTSVHEGGRGHPGFITRCLEDGLVFMTQGEAARHYDLLPSALSGHLNGKFPDAGGLHFERILLASEQLV